MANLLDSKLDTLVGGVNRTARGGGGGVRMEVIAVCFAGKGLQCLWMTRQIRLRRESAAAASGRDEGDGEVIAEVREEQAWITKRVRRANGRGSAELPSFDVSHSGAR